MKINYLVLVSFIVFCSVVKTFAQTVITEGYVNGTWTKEASPYLVVGNIEIKDSTVLKIEAGVRVEFRDSCHLSVKGVLNALGAEGDSILFTNADTSQSWCGIRFIDTVLRHNPSVIKYCIIENTQPIAGLADTISSGLYFKHIAQLDLSHSRISNCHSSNIGGGVCCLNCEMVLHDLLIDHCSAPEGGALTCWDSRIELLNSKITNNSATYGFPAYKGSIVLNRGSSLVQGNIIHNNSFGISGEAHYDSLVIIENDFSYNDRIVIIANGAKILRNTISKNSGAVIMENCSEFKWNEVVNNNSSGLSIWWGFTIVSENMFFGNKGSAIYVVEGGSEIIGNVFAYNEANKGGAVCMTNNIGSISLYGNYFYNNKAVYGGAIYYHPFTGGIPALYRGWSITNNVIVNNSAERGGGVWITASGEDINFSNNTIAFNEAIDGGGLFGSIQDFEFCNNIFYKNHAENNGNNIFATICDTVSFYHNVISSLVDSSVFLPEGTLIKKNEGNLYTDSLFVKPSEGYGYLNHADSADWSLKPSSPAINAGYMAIDTLLPEFDFAGNPRIFDEIVDIGALEYQYYLSISEYQDKNDMMIFPNPVQKSLYLKGIDQAECDIINLAGRRCDRTKITDGQAIDVSGLSNGVYYIIIKSEGKRIVRKFIKI